MLKFLKRQWRTKSGKNAIFGLGATAIGVASGQVPIWGGIAAAYGLVQTMFLRDKEAKKEEAKRENGDE